MPLGAVQYGLIATKTTTPSPTPSVSVTPGLSPTTTPSKTPSPSITPTVTSTPSVTPAIVLCFDYVDFGNEVRESKAPSGTYNGKPYYDLTKGFVWFNPTSNLWLWTETLGNGDTYDYLDNGGL